VLLEVGLGGRLDATNVIDAPLASVITPIGMDHVEFLGNTLIKIATEKAGIIKKNVPVICAEQIAEATAAIEQTAKRARAPLHAATQDWHVNVERGRLVYSDERGLLDLSAPRLFGRHQFDNAGLAIAALRAIESLKIEPSAFEQGIARAEWPARLQRLIRGRIVDLAPPGAEVWLDGGHNEDGGRVLAEAMAEFHDKAPRPLALICGAQTTKDIRALLKHFVGLAREVVAVPVEGEHKSWPPEDVANLARAEGMPGAAAGGVEEALALLSTRSFDAPPRVLIAGSLYLAASVLAANGSLVE